MNESKIQVSAREHLPNGPDQLDTLLILLGKEQLLCQQIEILSDKTNKYLQILII